MKDIIIIGAGAAGLAAAVTAADTAPEADILLVEALEKVGKKILATGNGKCNLTNAGIALSDYHTRSPETLGRLLEQMPTQRTLAFFSALGLACMEDSAGRVYPYARQASMVLDVLRLAVELRKGIEVRCGCRVEGIRSTEKGFQLTSETGERLCARRVILTTGGRAAPKQGSDGTGYALAQSLGHSCTPLAPALVPLKCRGKWFKTLKGLRVLCTAQLYQGKKCLGSQQGEVQFTDYGLSGIPIFQLSCLLTAENEIALDLVPEYALDRLREDFLLRQRRSPGESVEDSLLGLLPKRLQFVLLREAGIDPALPVGQLSRRELERLASLYKHWRIPVWETQGWQQAQVTLGGVPLGEIGADFASKKCAGLYLAGEILDVTGACGGYNLHWAWCSGMEAGRAAAGRKRRHNP